MLKKKSTWVANYFDQVLLPGGVFTPAAVINSACRRLFLCSILWDVLFHNVTTGRNSPLQTNTDILYGFTLGTIPPTTFAKVMNVILPPAPALNNTEITLHTPGQFFYNDIQFENQIAITLDYTNLSAANTYHIFCHILIETQE